MLNLLLLEFYPTGVSKAVVTAAFIFTLFSRRNSSKILFLSMNLLWEAERYEMDHKLH